MDKLLINKQCVVCGDQACGLNYTVWTCISCKSFYRRNHLKLSTFTCNYGNKCIVDILTRKYCKKCRLSKCLTVGMRTIYDRKEMFILLKNELKKLDNNSHIVDKYCENNNITTNETMNFDNQNLKHDFSYQNNFQKITNNSLITPFIKPISIFNNNNLNEIENYKQKKSVKVNQIKSIPQAMANNFEELMKKLIKMFKQLAYFKEMSKQDQYSLVKYGSMEMCVIRQIIAYDMNSQYVNLTSETGITSHIKFDLLNELFPQISQVYGQYLIAFNSNWDSDPIIMDLITTIALFNPNRSEVKHRDVVKLLNQIYTHLLYRYLLVKCGSKSEAESKVANLMNSFQQLRLICKLLLDEFMTIPNKFNYGPLLKSIFFDNHIQ
ncbi:nuclear hormone receptor HR96-like [Oppia nitens]|uniref:nuclear hormone receptor HR96-like n=1 Tax=Oppia nitens TaxID=1686743 RepID=UPI0023DAD46E|nr:nuclear hormone receptor HR96-like [Oppia nitens]